MIALSATKLSLSNTAASCWINGTLQDNTLFQWGWVSQLVGYYA